MAKTQYNKHWPHLSLFTGNWMSCASCALGRKTRSLVRNRAFVPLRIWSSLFLASRVFIQCLVVPSVLYLQIPFLFFHYGCFWGHSVLSHLRPSFFERTPTSICTLNHYICALLVNMHYLHASGTALKQVIHQCVRMFWRDRSIKPLSIFLFLFSDHITVWGWHCHVYIATRLSKKCNDYSGFHNIFELTLLLYVNSKWDSVLIKGETNR